MRNYLFCTLLLVATSALAQNVAVLTHQAENTEKFQQGFPGGWPSRHPIDIGASDKLPEGLKSPWVVMTKVALKAQMESLASAVESWVPPKPAETVAREQLIADIVSDLRAIRQSSGPLSADQISNALRRIARALLIMIEEERVSLK